MNKINLHMLANQLPIAWRSSIVGKEAGVNLKVLRMDASAYPAPAQDCDEALLVLAGQMNLEIEGKVFTVPSGEIFIVPAGTPHAVGHRSIGTLVPNAAMSTARRERPRRDCSSQ